MTQHIMLTLAVLMYDKAHNIDVDIIMQQYQLTCDCDTKIYLQVLLADNFRLFVSESPSRLSPECSAAPIRW